ncbi:erythrocyte development [Pristimantis euphronides]
MVFFTCNACGESLKKGQAEKHLTICRKSQCLSCIDCGKDFWGDDYKTHQSCVTEDEKYGGKAFEAKANKGDVKQQQWIQKIQEEMKKPDISDNIRNILKKISTFNNVPRKKVKFQNWMTNCLKLNDPDIQDKVWEILEAATRNQNNGANNNAPEPSKTPAAQSKSSEANEEIEKKSKRERKEERQKKNKKEKKDVNSEEQLQNGTKKKGKKRKMENDERNEVGNDEASNEEATGKKKQLEHKGDDASEDAEKEAPRKKKKRNDPEAKLQEEKADEDVEDEKGEGDDGKKGKFNWKGTIKALLRLAPDNELPIKKLRKKVIAQYYLISSEQHRSKEEILATFNKKIQKNPKFKVLKENVKLVK